MALMAVLIAFILLIVAFFAWVALRGWMRGSAQTHDERSREAMKATLVSLNEGHAESPSWANNPKKMHAFTYGIRKLLDHTGISVEERKALFAEEGTQEGLMTYAAHMERKGASFIQQQLGAGEFATQMAQAFHRRSASSNPIDLAAEKEAAGRGARSMRPCGNPSKNSWKCTISSKVDDAAIMRQPSTFSTTGWLRFSAASTASLKHRMICNFDLW